VEAIARKTMIEYSRMLYEKGYMPGIDGNISMRVDESTAIVTPSGVCKGVLQQDDLVLMSMDGEQLSGDRKPTSEAPMHLAALRLREDIDAVIHAHSPQVLSFAIARKPIDTRCAPFAYEHLKEVGYVRYFPPGSDGLHNTVNEAIEAGYAAFILEQHGSMVLGETMADAFAKTDLLEAYAGMLLGAATLGGPYVMTDSEIAEIHGG